MKHLGPVLALLILAVCCCIRVQEAGLRNPPLASGGVDCAPKIAPAEREDLCVMAGVAEVRTDRKQETKKADPTESQAPSTETASDIRDLLNGLRLSLELTEDQTPRIAAALRERAQDLQDSHGAIRRSGVFSPRDYGRELLRMKETWFRQVDAVLDSTQHARFSEMVKAGYFRPGTEFLVDLDEVIVLR